MAIPCTICIEDGTAKHICANASSLAEASSCANSGSKSCMVLNGSVEGAGVDNLLVLANTIVFKAVMRYRGENRDDPKTASLISPFEMPRCLNSCTIFIKASYFSCVFVGISESLWTYPRRIDLTSGLLR